MHMKTPTKIKVFLLLFVHRKTLSLKRCFFEPLLRALRRRSNGAPHRWNLWRLRPIQTSLSLGHRDAKNQKTFAPLDLGSVT